GTFIISSAWFARKTHPWPMFVPGGSVLVSGIGLLGHAVASLVPWGWSPYPAALITVAVGIGITAGLFAIGTRGKDLAFPASRYGAIAGAVALTFLITLACAQIPGWPFEFAWTWSGWLVLLPAAVAAWIVWDLDGKFWMRPLVNVGLVWSILVGSAFAIL